MSAKSRNGNPLVTCPECGNQYASSGFKKHAAIASKGDIISRLRAREKMLAMSQLNYTNKKLLREAADFIEELRWQRDHALQCGECAEWGDGCATVRARMIEWGERNAE